MSVLSTVVIRATFLEHFGLIENLSVGLRLVVRVQAGHLSLDLEGNQRQFDRSLRIGQRIGVIKCKLGVVVIHHITRLRGVDKLDFGDAT